MLCLFDLFSVSKYGLTLNIGYLKKNFIPQLIVNKMEKVLRAFVCEFLPALTKLSDG